MEIIDFIRGRWLVLAVAAPVLAGVIAFTVISGMQTERYEARGTIAVSQAVPGEIAAQNLRLHLESFVATLESTETARAINAELGMTLAEAAEALTVDPTVADLVEVRFVADTAERAEQGLGTAVRTGLFEFLERERERATVAADATGDRVDALSAELAAIESEAGVQDVALEYRNLSGDILSLRNQVATATVTQPTVAAALEQLLLTKQAERARLGAVVGRYERIRGALDSATGSLMETESQLARIDALLDAARQDGVVASPQVAAQSSFATTVRATVAAVVGALGAVILGAILVNRRTVVPPQPTERANAMDRSRTAPPPVAAS